MSGADVRADADAIREVLAEVVRNHGWYIREAEALPMMAALDALVASLTAARQERATACTWAAELAGEKQAAVKARERAEAQAKIDADYSTLYFGNWRKAEAALRDARQREQQLTQALADIADGRWDEKAAPRQTPSDWARDRAAAVLAGEAPPTAPPESVRQEQPDAPDGGQPHG